MLFVHAFTYLANVDTTIRPTLHIQPKTQSIKQLSIVIVNNYTCLLMIKCFYVALTVLKLFTVQLGLGKLHYTFVTIYVKQSDIYCYYHIHVPTL